MQNHSSKPKRPRDINQLAKFVVDLATGEIPAEPEPVAEPTEDAPKTHEKLPAAVELGRRGGLKGGKARAESMTPERRAEIARRAATARWNKKSN
jgi:hypothetical protein